jgi:predicted phosphodiesterase
VDWEIPTGAQLVREVAGLKFLLWHGDGVRSSMPGVPWGGVMRRWNELKSTYAAQGTLLDYVVVGHFHQACVVPGVFMNGSVVGPNAYGLKNFGGGQRATQLLITVDERKSRVTDVCYLTPS